MPPAATANNNKKAKKTKAARAGLVFAVPPVARFLRDAGGVKRMSGSVPVMVTAALEYICAEYLEGAGKRALASKEPRVRACDIEHLDRHDPALARVLRI